MKKTFLIAALFIGVLLFAGGYAESSHSTEIGRQAPALAYDPADSLISLDRLRGDYVLLTFWSSTDAPSRQAANLYTAWQRRHPEAPLQLVGVNFDDSQGLFNEIVRRDSLESDEQFHISGERAIEATKKYGLDQGFGSVLINPAGTIVAYDPDPAELDALMHTNTLPS